MRHVSELTIPPPAASEQPTASAASLTDKHIALLWERMAMIYGHKWTSSYGDKDDGTWLTGLSDITVDQVKRGLEECRQSSDDWPPSLPVFRSRCLVGTRQYAAPYHRPFASLPKPKGDETTSAALAQQERIGRNIHGHFNAFRPGESLDDYLRAFRKSGMKLADFETQRLRENARKTEQ